MLEPCSFSIIVRSILIQNPEARAVRKYSLIILIKMRMRFFLRICFCQTLLKQISLKRYLVSTENCMRNYSVGKKTISTDDKCRGQVERQQFSYNYKQGGNDYTNHRIHSLRHQNSNIYIM